MLELCESLDILSVDVEAKRLGVFIAYTYTWLDKRRTCNYDPLEEEINRLVNYLRSKYTLEKLREDSVVRAYRDFYWKIKIDPTKIRPSSEALVRRTLRGSFPRINLIVDAGNIASAYTMIPISVYDLDMVKLPIKLTISRGGEVFRPIGGGEIVLEEGLPILVDSRGVIMHVYPYRDSVETVIRENTVKALIIAAGVPGVDSVLVKRAAELTAEILEKIGWKWCKIVKIV